MNQPQYPPTEVQKSEELSFLPPGTVIDSRFEIRKVIGGGGFSIVYQAWDMLMNSFVAVKEFFPNQFAERSADGKRVEAREGKNRFQFAQWLEHFSREAMQTASLGGKHNVLNVISFAEENGTAYMVMEFLDGMTLKEYQKTLPGGIFSDLSEAVTIIAAMAEALSYCHKQKILHRDVSADNIFLCSDGAMKLIDFGNAHEEMEGDVSSIVAKGGCTPPEQYSYSGKQGPWTDLYALSAVFYRMLTGEYPDTAPDRQAEGAPELKSTRETNPEVPEYIDALIMRCLDLNYRLRLSSAEEYLRILRSGRVVHNSAKVQEMQRVAAFAAAFGSVAFLSLLAAVAAVMWRNSQILEPCTLNILVPEHFSTDEGLAEAERLFEEKWDTVDVVFLTEDNDQSEPDLYPLLSDEETAPIAIDSTVLYINLLKARKNNTEIPEWISEEMVTDSYAEFISPDNASCVYRGHPYEYRTIEVEPTIMAQFEVRKDTQNRECAVGFACSEDLSPAEQKAAQTMIDFLQTEAAQKALFLEQCGMQPANPDLLDDYSVVYNKFDYLNEGEEKNQ